MTARALTGTFLLLMYRNGTGLEGNPLRNLFFPRLKRIMVCAIEFEETYLFTAVGGAGWELTENNGSVPALKPPKI